MEIEELFWWEANVEHQKYDYEAVVSAIFVTEFDRKSILPSEEIARISLAMSSGFYSVDSTEFDLTLPKVLQPSEKEREQQDIISYAKRTAPHWVGYYLTGCELRKKEGK